VEFWGTGLLVGVLGVYSQNRNLCVL